MQAGTNEAWKAQQAMEVTDYLGWVRLGSFTAICYDMAEGHGLGSREERKGSFLI